jgi:hypothetical protein
MSDVSAELPEPIADDKGMTRYRQTLVDWLPPFVPEV